GGFEEKEVEKSEDRSGKGYRILVVEDDAVTALFLHDTLRRLDHDVVALASTGGEAIRWAESKQPDVILMDIWLAGPMSGIEAAAALAGVAAGAAIGKPVASLLKLVDPASQQPLAVDQAWNGEAVLVDGTGREVPIVGSIANISPDRTEGAGQVMVLRDVTEH